jgi:hypothetical protein
VFTVPAAVIAATVSALPFAVRTARAALVDDPTRLPPVATSDTGRSLRRVIARLGRRLHDAHSTTESDSWQPGFMIFLADEVLGQRGRLAPLGRSCRRSCLLPIPEYGIILIP